MNNRRAFLQQLIKAGIGASILPAAVTYTRTWKRSSDSNLFTPNLQWEEADYEVYFWIGANGYETINIGPPPNIQNFDKSKYRDGETIG